MTFGGEVVINTPENVRRMAAVMYPIGVRPEFELFDSGDVLLLRDLIADGAVPAAPALLAGAWDKIRLSANH